MKTPMEELDEFWLSYDLKKGKSGLRLKIKQLLQKEKTAYAKSWEAGKNFGNQHTMDDGSNFNSYMEK